MGYLSTYWEQVRIFYRIIIRNLFQRERNLDGALSDFVMKPGFIWEFLTAHKWLALSAVHLVKSIVQLLTCYLAMVLLCAFLLCAPLFILVMFPVFTVGRYRRIKAQGAVL